MNQLGFTVSTRIGRPSADVHRVLVDHQELARFFVDRASGPLRGGEEVRWVWNNYGEHKVRVKEILPEQRIELSWVPYHDADYWTEIIIELSQLATDSTLVRITERGWRPDEAGIKSALDNSAGWTDMLKCMKAYLQHGVDLRG